MNYRPYPDSSRALAQLERGRVPAPPLCPICDHAVARHATEDGQPACIRGSGPISCRDCAERWARDPQIAALIELGRNLAGLPQRHVLLVQARRTGKAVIVRAVTHHAVKGGEHVHIATRSGVRCAGGDGACTLPRTEQGP